MTQGTEANYRHQQFKEHYRWRDKFLQQRQGSRHSRPVAFSSAEDLRRGGTAHGHRCEEREEAEAAQ